MKNDEKNLWFRARRYGYGWIPCSWQGWGILVLYILALISWAGELSTPLTIPAFFFLMAAATAALLVICILKGEIPHWYFGNRPEKPIADDHSPAVFLLFLVPLMLVVVGFWIEASVLVRQPVLAPVAVDSPAAKSAAVSSLPALIIGGQTIHLEVANTAPLREQGLSGHAPLAANQGMIFIFPEPARDGFWMKDMLFSLDMIWLDSNYQVITIKKNATPASFPSIFYPTAPATYVLELPAGFASSHGIALGMRLDIVR